MSTILLLGLCILALTSSLHSLQNKPNANIQRALSVLGAVCRFHDELAGDEELGSIEEGSEAPTSDALTFSNLTSIFENLFSTFLSKSETQIKCAALRGLCGVFISRPREMLRMDETGLISQVMAPSSPLSLQLESLICWRDILLVSCWIASSCIAGIIVTV
jgi:hypothetical protein